MKIPSNPKKVIYIILALLIIAAGVFSVIQYRVSHSARWDLTLKELDQLSDKRKQQALVARELELTKQFDELSKDASVSEKYLLYTQLAEVRIGLGKFQEAIKVLEIMPLEKINNSRVTFANAQAYRGVGENARAKAYYLKTVDLDETNVEAWKGLFEIPGNATQEELADWHERSVKGTKNNLDLVISYARFLGSVGDKTQAIIYWETARNVNPDGAEEYAREIAKLR